MGVIDQACRISPIRALTFAHFSPLRPLWGNFVKPTKAALRKPWELREITAESPYLICSDDPVVVVDADGEYLEPFHVLHPDSTVFIPLSRTHLLATVSTSSEQSSGITIDEVAKLNSYQLGKSRKLFSCEPKIYVEINGTPTWFEK